MSCLNSETIQKYLDKELLSAQLMTVESHLKECASCRLLVDEHRLNIAALNHEVGELWEDELLEVPVFKIEKITHKKPLYKTFWWVAAILIPAFVYVGSLRNENEFNEALQRQMMLDIQYQGDLNSQWHDGEFNTIVFE